MSQNGTGAAYPTIELAGVTYELRISREVLLYRLSRKGISLADLRGPKGFATLHDVLYAIVQDRYPGGVEDLVSLIQAEGKLKLLDVTLSEVVKKVFPSTLPAPAAVEAQPEKPAVQ